MSAVPPPDYKMLSLAEPVARVDREAVHLVLCVFRRAPGESRAQLQYAPRGAGSRAPLGVGPCVGPLFFPLAAVAPADRPLVNALFLRPCAINPCATASSGWVLPHPSRELGCQLARAPPRPAWVSGRPGARPPSQHKAALWGLPGAGWRPGGEWKIS